MEFELLTLSFLFAIIMATTMLGVLLIHCILDNYSYTLMRVITYHITYKI
ncbi:hypothetical protein COK_2170 [Mannheimia haemolytica serotype A2 str. BOVINE]|nr:hypothetical protein COK_2170 [Mannheimia haemolytica serotype A2 str. BOVINE]